MNILQVIPFFAPAWSWGGPPRLTYALSKELVKRGHKVTVYTTDTLDKISRQEEKFLEMEGIKVFYFRNLSNSLASNHMLFFCPGMIPRLRREVKNFDVIHLQNYRDFLNVTVRYYANKYGIPYVLQANGSVLPIFRKQGLKRIFDKLFGYRVLEDAARVIALHETEANEYKQMGVNQGKIVVVPPATPMEDLFPLPPFGRFRRKYNIREKHMILFLGRIAQIKGIDFLVESFYQLNQQREDVMLAIVGPDGGYRSTLERLINNLGLSKKVLFTGFLGGVDKASAFVDASILVQTSIYERGPGSPFEAILCNTPIIVTKDTGCADVVAEVDAGYLVKYGDVNELKTMMEKILDDPTEARERTRKAKQYIIENLSYEKRVEDYERVYESVIEQRRVA